MKKSILIYSLIFIGLQTSCSDKDSSPSMANITITAENIADKSPLGGGTYRILNVNQQEVGIYTLDNSGKIIVTNLKEGTYTIEEVSAPQGYITQQAASQRKYVSDSPENFVFTYINADNPELPVSQKVLFYTSEHDRLLDEYNAVRIGEYYWIDRNFTTFINWGENFENIYPITQELLDKYMATIRIDKSQFQLANINDLEKYYGRYYSYPSVLYMDKYCFMKNEYGVKIDGWGLPNPRDFRQLFGMCPFNTSIDRNHTELNERDVRFALSVRPGENPMAYNIQDPSGEPYKTYWFSEYNTNIYNFNLMPGGARLNGDGPWCNDIDCYNGNTGDIYQLFYTAYFATKQPQDDISIGAIKIHDRVDTQFNILYHLMNVRFCRRLTDEELGYKLYINESQTDIKKLDLNTPVPDGYKELQNGYTRGFYVQYILDNPNPSRTAADIVKYARSVEDIYSAENNKNYDVVL